jgi:hypothetical protein
MPITFYTNPDEKKKREFQERDERRELFRDFVYNPDQPRDPKGSETGGQWAGNKNSKMQDKIDRIRKMFPEAKNVHIIYSEEPSKINPNRLGEYNPKTRTIKIFRDMTDEEVYGILAHELSHEMFSQVMQKGDTSQLSMTANMYHLFTKTPTFSAYATSFWIMENTNITNAIGETVAEVNRIELTGNADDIPEGWRIYARQVRMIYGNLYKL